tara:strand:- start:70 stop:912 length:843 start_codon:yes stop_codon:yes gene_type:complete
MIIYKSNKEFTDVLKKLKSCCLSKNIILHSDVFKLGFLKIKLSYLENLKLIHDLILDVFYDFEIIVPSFNYDFLVTKFYDVRKDKSQVGTLNEYFRKKYILNRTYTPVFNFISTKKNLIIKKASCIDPHGKKSFYNTAYEKNYDILFLGKFIPSMAHFVERKINVPYRYEKKFTGKIKYLDGKISPISIRYNVRPLFNGEIETDFNKIIRDLKKNKILFSIENRNSFVGCYNSKIVSDFWIKKNSSNNMYFLTKKSSEKAKILFKKFGYPLTFKKVESNF